MRQKLPTLLILMVMVLVGAMYWVDLSYYTDPVTGFIERGEVWMRYAVVAFPVLMCLLGLRTIGPKAISVLRVQNRALGVLFAAAAVVGVSWGGTRIVFSLNPVNTFNIVLGFVNIWYGVWMFMVCLQMFSQTHPAPTKSATWGVVAAMPFAMTTIQRILVSPSSIYRVGPLVRSITGLLAMLWVGLLLRSFYIALPRRRVRWLYLVGVLTFLFGTCLEFPLALHSNIFHTTGQGNLELFESLNMGMLGLVAGAVSLSIAGRTEVKPKKKKGEDTEPAEPVYDYY
ncbi:hypothetical protein LJC64_00525 [Ruminococcaceae bacterium OttesenSCG-928-A11]|nr:hypothetical protein [Ruminococcaceae bacterium OttesenSCG-928-A11]